MSARDALVAGVAARLRGCAGLAGTAVFDAAPVRAGLPHAVIEEPVLGEWSGVGWRGREGRLLVTIADAGERPVRLRALLAAAEEWLADMPAPLTGGWRIAQLRLARSRIARAAGTERWLGSAEFAVRLWRADA